MRSNKKILSLAIAVIITAILVMYTAGCEQQKAEIEKRPTENAEAYDLYLMGRHLSREFPSQRSLEYYQKAVEMDPNFAAAYAEIAFLQASFGRSSGELPVEAKNALERAFELDDTLPGVYTARGLISMHYDWDWRTAEDSYKKAIEIDPNYMTTYMEIDNLLMLLGREQEALELQRKALEIVPFSLGVMTDIMPVLGYLGNYEEAIQFFQKIAVIDSTWTFSYPHAGFIHANQGEYEEAIAAFTKQAQVTGYSGPQPGIGYVYGLMGKRAEAEKILADFQGNVVYENIIRLGFKDFDPIFEMLENQYNERSPQLPMNLLTYKRRSKDMVSDPRWKALMEKMGLPE